MAVGESRAACSEGQAVVVTQDMPTLIHIAKARPEQPFVGLGLELDLSGMREVIEQLTRSSRAQEDAFELFVEERGLGSNGTEKLRKTATRLLR